jgi:hypothetical protein
MLKFDKKKWVIGLLISGLYVGTANAGIFDWAKGLFSGGSGNTAAATAATKQSVPAQIDQNVALGDDCLKSLQKERQDKIDADGRIIDGMIKVPEVGIADMPCLKRFEDFKISSTIGLPSFQGVIDNLKKQACTAVDNGINKTSQKVSDSVNIGGGGIVNGTINTGVFNGGAGTPPVVVNKPTVNDTSGGMPNIFGKLGL